MIDREAALKQLQAEKTEVERQLAEYKAQVAKFSRDISESMDQIKDLSDRIGELEAGEVVITDHAVLRYLERVRGIEVEALRDGLVPERVRTQMTMLGAGKFPVTQNGEKYTLIVKDRKVITVVTKEGQKK